MIIELVKITSLKQNDEILDNCGLIQIVKSIKIDNRIVTIKTNYNDDLRKKMNTKDTVRVFKPEAVINKVNNLFTLLTIM